jgi:rfaE bifunctional protein nucleotidyltransferase chain/domain
MNARDKVVTWEELRAGRARARAAGRKVVFTNGCFDLLHAGHVRYLEAARALGDVLIVAVNSDASVRRLGKGADRPFNDQRVRAEVVAALACVDFVTVFDEDTPAELIAALMPDVLVKGGDWPVETIVGAEVVMAAGGRVLALPFEEGFSTTALVERIRRSAQDE